MIHGGFIHGLFFGRNNLIDPGLCDRKRAGSVRVVRIETEGFVSRSLQVDPLMLLPGHFHHNAVGRQIVRVQPNGSSSHIESLLSSPL